MPRIVGRGGAGLDKLRTGGVEVEVVGRKDANRESLTAFASLLRLIVVPFFAELTLTGTPDAIEAAHQHILQLAAPRPPRQQYNREPREDY